MKDVAVGIDIGRSNTKVVLIEKKENFILKEVFLFKTPFTGGEYKWENIDKDKFFDLLGEKIPFEVLHDSNISVNIEQNSLIVISLLLPPMPKKELEAAAQLEAKRKMIAQPIEQSIFRYIAGKKTPVHKENKIEVIVVRSDRSSVDSVLNLFQHKSLTPFVVAPPAALLLNLKPESLKESGDSDVAFVDIGAEAMSVAIYRGEKFVFFRNIAYGLNEIINSLASSLGVSKDYAHEVVEKADIMNIEKANLGGILEEKESINPYALKILWQHNIERIIQELRRTLIYYKEASGGRRVAKFLFVGGGAQVKNLISLAMDQIGGSSEIVNPFLPLTKSGNDIKDRDEMPIFSNAVALALQAFNLSPQAPNFLPFSLQNKYLYLKRQLIVRYLLISLIFLFSFFSFRLFSLSRDLSREAESLAGKLKELAPVVKKNEEIKQRLKQLYEKTNKVKNIVAERVPFYEILEKLPFVIPQGVVLNNLSLKPQAESASQSPAMISPRSFPRSPRASRVVSSKSPDYYLQGEGEYWGTYEELQKVTDEFKENLRQIHTLGDVEIKIQLLEKMVPYSYTKEGITELSFTKPKLRTFSFKAKLEKRSE